MGLYVLPVRSLLCATEGLDLIFVINWNLMV